MTLPKGKLFFMSTLIYVLRQFWSFISIFIKRNSYERLNKHHIVKISGISLQIGNMKLCTLNPNPNTTTKLLLGSKKSVRKMSIFKNFLLTQIS